MLQALKSEVGMTNPISFIDPSLSSELIEVTKAEQNRFIMQRFANIEQIRDASIVGLLVGTVTVNGYNEMLLTLK